MTRDDDGDDVATLVRLAGPRPAVPAQRAERVRAAAIAAWRDGVRDRRRRRLLGPTLALAVAASLVAGLLLMRSDPPVGATVASLEGSAWVRGTAGAEGQPVPAGSEVVTAETGRIALRLPSGHSVRLDRHTTVRVLDGASLSLERGALYVDSGADAASPGPAVVVRTPLGTVREAGTQFELRLESGALRVRLREGRVVVQGGDDRTLEVSAGTELRLVPSGATVTEAIPLHGPDWGWVEAIAPVLDVEGRTAASFLEWVARERGWRLTYADPAVALSARTTRIAGSLAGLTLDQSLEAVLPSCRLTHRIEGGVLVVGAAP
jgi:ferric-dicitrate binding protein FerR (iron transport regulator)